jgi:DNA-binding NarL/FixJ family response regulator
MGWPSDGDEARRELAIIRGAVIPHSSDQSTNGHLRAAPRVDADTSPAISVILIDNEPVRRAGFRAVLERLNLPIIAEGSEHSTTLASHVNANENRAVVLLASGQSVASDIEVIAKLHRMAPQLSVIAIRPPTAPLEADQLLAAGARGCIRPNIGQSALYGAVAVAAEGGIVFVPAVTRRSIPGFGYRQADDPNPIAARLTRRQHEVLALLSIGLSNRAIAKRLVLSENTVKKHVSETLHKIGQPDRFGAGLYAIREGICP